MQMRHNTILCRLCFSLRSISLHIYSVAGRICWNTISIEIIPDNGVIETAVDVKPEKTKIFQFFLPQVLGPRSVEPYYSRYGIYSPPPPGRN